MMLMPMKKMSVHLPAWSSSSCSSSFCLLLSVRLLLLGCLDVASFNVDESSPLVKQGASTSYFGFSAVPHKIRRVTTANESHPVLLVGAPRDNITHPLASDVVRGTFRPGSVYSCPLTFDPTDCTQLPIAIEDPNSDEDRSDQWMGGSVASQTSDDATAIVCAHRYKRYGTWYRWGLGWCISLTNSLNEDRFWEPCAGKPKNKGHGEYGFCQAGTSVAISRVTPPPVSTTITTITTTTYTITTTTITTTTTIIPLTALPL